MEMSNSTPGNSAGESSNADGDRKPRLSAFGSLLGDLFKSQSWQDGERRRVLDELFFEGPEWRPFLSRFTILTVLSTTIAAFGLISNSAAVVIGAMVIAPLMTPILATAASLVHGQLGRRSMRTICSVWVPIGWRPRENLMGVNS